jgi:anti-sigma-K factor RskA
MTYKVMMLLLIISAGITSILSLGLPVAHAQQTLDITKSTEGKATGGEKVGTLTVIPQDHTLNIVANMSAPPADGKVFEGWLVDSGGSEYKLSLGEFQKNGTLQYKETLVNPYTYTQFIVTEEPFEDNDPNAAAAFAGAELQTPFAQ